VPIDRLFDPIGKQAASAQTESDIASSCLRFMPNACDPMTRMEVDPTRNAP
jgi:hypothetical protein